MELCFDLLLRWRKALKITCFAHKNGCILFLSMVSADAAFVHISLIGNEILN